MASRWTGMQASLKHGGTRWGSRLARVLETAAGADCGLSVPRTAQAGARGPEEGPGRPSLPLVPLPTPTLRIQCPCPCRVCPSSPCHDWDHGAAPRCGGQGHHSDQQPRGQNAEFPRPTCLMVPLEPSSGNVLCGSSAPNQLSKASSPWAPHSLIDGPL